MLAYAQLLVTERRRGVGKFVINKNVLSPFVSSQYLSRFQLNASLPIFSHGSKRLTAAKGQDRMAGKFGHGDPSEITQTTQKNMIIKSTVASFSEDDGFPYEEVIKMLCHKKFRRWYSCRSRA